MTISFNTGTATATSTTTSTTPHSDNFYASNDKPTARVLSTSDFKPADVEHRGYEFEQQNGPLGQDAVHRIQKTARRMSDPTAAPPQLRYAADGSRVVLTNVGPLIENGTINTALQAANGAYKVKSPMPLGDNPEHIVFRLEKRDSEVKKN
jgi:hypothetical protein